MPEQERAQRFGQLEELTADPDQGPAQRMQLMTVGNMNRSAVEHLAAICHALDRLRVHRDLGQFSIDYGDPLPPFLEYIDRSADNNDLSFILAMWSEYHRFVLPGPKRTQAAHALRVVIRPQRLH